MKEFLGRLFSAFESPEKDAPPRDGLTQPQREALVDLLLMVAYADNHLALAEREVLDEQVESLDWHGEPLSMYLEEATARVRGIDDTPAWLGELAERLETEEVKSFAVELAIRCFKADGDLDVAEVAFLKELRAALG